VSSRAPIALFIYRRPEHTRRTLLSLIACDELADSPFCIYCDGPKTPDALAEVRETRRVARSLAPVSATFIERDTNHGLARSIIVGTTELTKKFGRVIVVEDDLEVARDFLRFMNDGLDRYANDDRVMQVSGYQFPLDPPLATHPVFFSFTTSWGWATWTRAWKHFDADASGYAQVKADRELRRRFELDGSYPYFEMLERQRRGEIDSWAIRWHLSVFMHGGLVLYPGRSLVHNTGFDGSGTHGAPGWESTGLAELPAIHDQLPDVVLDAVAQRRVFAFLASRNSTTALTRAKQLAAKWLPASWISAGKRFIRAKEGSK